MSLTTIIQYDDECREFFKLNSPQKSEFKTISGNKPFSKEYEQIAEYRLSNKHYSSVVGTAFDYIARWIVAKNVSQNREDIYKDLVAERGLNKCVYAAEKNEIDIVQKYRDAIEICKKFVDGERTLDEIIKVSIFFAKLEHIRRMVVSMFDVDIEYILTFEEEIVNDLRNLAKAFEGRFVKNGLISSESKVVYNPTFGGASVICDGADADIYIDGTLYDFKCTKRTGYAWNESAQILGYFLLDVIAKKYNDTYNCLNGLEIERIAIYRARYGEVEYIDIQDKHYKLADKFEQILGKESYKNYLNEKKEYEEKERIREEKFDLEFREIERQYNKIIGYVKSDYLDDRLEQCKNKEEYLQYMRYAIGLYFLDVKHKIDGNKLRRIMENRNMSIENIEEEIDRKKTTIKNWLYGKTSPSTKDIFKLSEILKCQIGDIIKISKNVEDLDCQIKDNKKVSKNGEKNSKKIGNKGKSRKNVKN